MMNTGFPRGIARKRLLLLAALCSSATAVLAQPAPLAPASAAAPPHEQRFQHRWHRPHSAFMRALHSLDLSETQRQQIRDLVRAQWQQFKPQMRALREARRRFDHAIPGTGEFSQAQSALAQVAENTVQARLQFEVNLRNQIYALLTDPQKSQLAQALSAAHAKAP